jgi:hypothetical protein
VGSWLLVGDLAQSRHAADGSPWLSGAWPQGYGDEHVPVACLEGVDGQERMFWDGGLALLWRQVLSLPTVHSILGVDSAEADKVGSQGFRFCAYADCAPYRGVWHRRTTSVRYYGLLYCCGDV